MSIPANETAAVAMRAAATLYVRQRDHLTHAEAARLVARMTAREVDLISDEQIDRAPWVQVQYEQDDYWVSEVNLIYSPADTRRRDAKRQELVAGGYRTRLVFCTVTDCDPINPSEEEDRS